MGWDPKARSVGTVSANTTIDCTATPSFTPPTATDDCSGATVNIVGSTTTGNTCTKVYTVSWDATDACGNHSTSETTRLNSSHNITSSVVSCSANKTIDCTATPSFTPPTA